MNPKIQEANLRMGRKLGRKYKEVAHPRNRRRYLKDLKFGAHRGPTAVPILAIKETETETVPGRYCKDQKIYNLKDLQK